MAVEDTTPIIETNTLIIGAGPAGLAVAACLTPVSYTHLTLPTSDLV